MGQVFSTYPTLASTGTIHQGRFPMLTRSWLYETLSAFLSPVDEDNESNSDHSDVSFDLNRLPPELALSILSKLNATDLCLASCVWRDLGSDEMLWQGLCHATWPFCSAYFTWKTKTDFSFRRLYLQLDEARLTFNGDAFEGIRYLQKYEILTDVSEDLVAFFHTAPDLDPIQKRRFLESRPDVLDGVICVRNFREQFLPNALRTLFFELPAPETETRAFQFITRLVDRFSGHFVQCNPHLGLSKDMVYVLCFSLILLSVDLSSPKIKNKMSKREFIRNTRPAVPVADDEFLGHLYDNVYLEGHVAFTESTRALQPTTTLAQNRPCHILVNN